MSAAGDRGRSDLLPDLTGERPRRRRSLRDHRWPDPWSACLGRIAGHRRGYGGEHLGLLPLAGIWPAAREQLS